MQESRELLVEMMGFHARRHHLIPVEIPHPACLFPSAIHQECTEEVYQFCVARNLPDAWAYLACEWYCVERWTLWARSAVSGVIPCADTTMMVESHWSLLKRHHLINSPRARLDRVIYILLQETIPHLLHKWRQALILRRYILPLEQDFLKDWNAFADLNNIEIGHNRYVDTESWICSCPAYFKNRFLICKHLYKVMIPLSHSSC